MTAILEIAATDSATAIEPGRVAQSAPVDAPAPVDPPTDRELYAYFGPQRRWVMLCMTVSFGLAGVSVVKFSSHNAWLYPLLVVVALNVAGAVLSLASGQRRRRFTKAGHIAMVNAWSPEIAPSVDVFLPTCGEPLEILTNTYRNVRNLQWDGPLRVVVLDDGASTEVAVLAAQFGFDYIVRPNRGYMKKAGNLAHGVDQTDGDFIVIFDADFCPRPDFLAHLLPYFVNDQVGIVQSPQCFDTNTDMSWLQRTAGATQELFYRWVQPSRDRAGAAICVGTNAIYRRSALEAAGGFAEIEHSEDVHTGIALIRAGFSMTYVPVQVAKGLCPDDLAAFMNQQYRWCNGSLTLLPRGEGQRFALKLRQRICFWAGFMYYVTTAVNVFAVHIPAIVMATFYSREIRPSHYLPFLAGVWVYVVLLPRMSKGRWRFEVLRVQMVYSFCHAVALFHKVTGRTAGWVATGALKGGNNLARSIARLGLSWLTAVMVISWSAAVWDVHNLGLHNLWPMVIFLSGYSYLSIPLIVDFARLLRADRAARRAVAAKAVTA